MARRYELIVFDWDGTVLDSASAIVGSIQAAARDLGLEVPSDERARHVIGLGLHEALKYAMPELPIDQHVRLAERYRHHYLAQDHELSLFDGIAELVEFLSRDGFRLGVATGKSRKGLDRAMAVSGLARYFHATRCADECHSKPHPQMLEELLDEFGATAGAALMIGDTSHDIEMAHNAGMDAVAVTYGAHQRDDLLACRPVACVDSVEELDRWLRANA